MWLAGLFACVLLIGLILGDWLYFVRLTPDAGRYGCGIARSFDRFSVTASYVFSRSSTPTAR